jgi:hypothetical protein
MFDHNGADGFVFWGKDERETERERGGEREKNHKKILTGATVNFYI